MPRRRRTGVQLKTATIKADLETLSGPRVFGLALWRKDWVKVSSELTQDRPAWSASILDVVNSIGDAGSTHPGVNAEVSFGYQRVNTRAKF